MCDEVGEVQTGLNTLREEVTQLRIEINNNFKELRAMFANLHVRRGLRVDDTSVHGPQTVQHTKTEEEHAIRMDEER